MDLLYLLFVGGMIFMMFRGGGCCGGGHSHSQNDQSKHEHSEHGHIEQNKTNNNYDSDKHKQIEMVTDPECGMHVDPDSSVKQKLDGETYYFCSETCRGDFVRKYQKNSKTA